MRLIYPDLETDFLREIETLDPKALWGSAEATLEGGRGGIKKVAILGRPCFIKLERRGGMAAGAMPDSYFFLSTFLKEWELSMRLSLLGLTPPILARWFLPEVLGYRVYSLLEPISRAASLVGLWKLGRLSGELVAEAGRCVGDLHRRGVLHGDLNLGNLLALSSGKIIAIDWRHSVVIDSLPAESRCANMLRLSRSFHKVRHKFGLVFPSGLWQRLSDGYGDGFGGREPWLADFLRLGPREFTLRKLLWITSG